MCKNIFIVFCHPDKDSLNGAMVDAAIETMEKNGHVVTVSDLYKMNFDPILGRHDIIGAFRYDHPEKHKYCFS